MTKTDQLYSYLCRLENWRPPTRITMAKAIGVTDGKGIQHHLNKLIAEGKITKNYYPTELSIKH